MDFSKITNNKYVDYFSKVDESSVNDEIMNEFLNEMIEASESIAKDNTIPPTEIVKEIKSRFGLDGSVYGAITQIASSDLINCLSRDTNIAIIKPIIRMMIRLQLFLSLLWVRMARWETVL